MSRPLAIRAQGGNVNIAAGSAFAAGNSGVGGGVSVTGGTGFTTGGNVSITGGRVVTSADTNNGTTYTYTDNTYRDGGSIVLTSGAGATRNSGNVVISTAASGATGGAGQVRITTGDSSATTSCSSAPCQNEVTAWRRPWGAHAALCIVKSSSRATCCNCRVPSSSRRASPR